MHAEGAVWRTGIAANRIIRVLPDGSWHQVAEDSEPEHMTAVLQAIADGTLNRDLLSDNHARVLPNVTSIAFGGPDLRTAYMGSVSGTQLAVFQAPVAGAPPVHWDW
jgi:sugar lactone lactonase YvrE